MTVSRKRLGEIGAIADEDIDTSEIPEADSAWFTDASVVLPQQARTLLEPPTPGRHQPGPQATFELHEDGHAVVSRADAEDVGPAIGAFLDLIEKEIQIGRGVEEIPGDVAKEMLKHANQNIAPDEPIEGDVDL